jgi:outer membrane protein, multidrug efflux system
MLGSSTLILTGCVARKTVAAQPVTTVAPTWGYNSALFDSNSSRDLSTWWRKLEDDTLASLIEQALKNNPDLGTARSRLREARAQRKLAEANRFPSASVSISAAPNKTSGSPLSNLFSESFDASWDPDVFGGLRNAVAAADADVRATRADLHNTQVSLVAEVALNYIQLRTEQSRAEIAHQNEVSQSETLQLTSWRAQAGLVSSVDVEQARTNLEQTRAGIPTLESSIAQSEHQLATLLGLPAPTLKIRLSKAASLPGAPETITVGIPAEALRQRPDVQAAEQRIVAETRRLRQQEAARFPTFSLTGSLGIQQLTGIAVNSGTAIVTGGTSELASLSASVLQTVFDAGRIRAKIETQNAVQEQAVIAYESTVLTAVKEVENNLVSVAKYREQVAALSAAEESSKNAAVLAKNRYMAGITDFQTVLDTERTTLTVQDSLAAAKGSVLTSVVQLYKALGGGWSSETAAVGNK